MRTGRRDRRRGGSRWGPSGCGRRGRGSDEGSGALAWGRGGRRDAGSSAGTWERGEAARRRGNIAAPGAEPWPGVTGAPGHRERCGDAGTPAGGAGTRGRRGTLPPATGRGRGTRSPGAAHRGGTPGRRARNAAGEGGGDCPVLCLGARWVTLDHARCAGGAGGAALSPPFSTANPPLRARQRGANPNPTAFLRGSAPPAPSSRGPIRGCARPNAGREAGSARAEPARLTQSPSGRLRPCRSRRLRSRRRAGLPRSPRPGDEPRGSGG